MSPFPQSPYRPAPLHLRDEINPRLEDAVALEDHFEGLEQQGNDEEGDEDGEAATAAKVSAFPTPRLLVIPHDPRLERVLADHGWVPSRRREGVGGDAKSGARSASISCRSGACRGGCTSSLLSWLEIERANGIGGDCEKGRSDRREKPGEGQNHRKGCLGAGSRRQKGE